MPSVRRLLCRLGRKPDTGTGRREERAKRRRYREKERPFRKGYGTSGETRQIHLLPQRDRSARPFRPSDLSGLLTRHCARKPERKKSRKKIRKRREPVRGREDGAAGFLRTEDGQEYGATTGRQSRGEPSVPMRSSLRRRCNGKPERNEQEENTERDHPLFGAMTARYDGAIPSGTRPLPEEPFRRPSFRAAAYRQKRR